MQIMGQIVNTGQEIRAEKKAHDLSQRKWSMNESKWLYHFQRKLRNTSNITLDTLVHFNEEEYLFSVICYFLAHHLHGYKVQSLT